MRKISLIYLATQNLKRKRLRTLAIVVCMTVVTGTFFAATLIMRGVNHSLRSGVDRFGADLIVTPEGTSSQIQDSLISGQASTYYMKQDVESKLRSIRGVVKTSSQIFVKSLIGTSCCSWGDIFIIGFDPVTDFTITPWLRNRIESPLKDNDVIIGAYIPVEEENILRFYGQEFTVKGKLEPTGLGIDNTVYIPMPGVRRMIAESNQKAEVTLDIQQNQISAILIKTRVGKSSWDKSWWDMNWQVAYEIQKAIPDVHVTQMGNIIKYVRKQTSGILKSIYLGSGISWVIFIILISIIFFLVINERFKEIGLLRALGSTQSYVFRLILLEAGFATLLGGGTGIIISSVMLYSFNILIFKSLAIPFLWPNMISIIIILVLTAFLSVLTGILSSLYPASYISKMAPYDAIRRGN